MTDDWADLSRTIESLRARNRLRKLQPFAVDGMTLVDAQGCRLINFGSNDYLGLSARECRPTNNGPAASSLVCGWTDRHQMLANQIANLEQTESAVVFPSGFAACSSTVAALGRGEDLILSDELNHASLIDGCRLARAQCIVFPHRDVGFVADRLRECRSAYSRVWIVTESVFSMDGHVAPLADLCDVAEQAGATMIVDEAHATGVFGQTGGGMCDELGVKERVPIRIGTLSKALASRGGFVAGPKAVTDFLVNHCRALIFSTSLSPDAVESSIHAIEKFSQDSTGRDRVRSIARRLRDSIGSSDHGLEGDVPIVPVLVGDDLAALSASAHLRERGLYVPAIRPPTVPEGMSRLRISLSAGHTDAMIARLTAGLQSLRLADKFGGIA